MNRRKANHPKKDRGFGIAIELPAYGSTEKTKNPATDCFPLFPFGLLDELISAETPILNSGL
jgi:hypothetical protein